MEPLSRPNLPDGPVRAAMIGCSAEPALRRSLLERGVEPLFCGPVEALPPPVRDHPDMLFHHAARGLLFCLKTADDGLRRKLADCGYDVRRVPEEPKSEYPGDALLNGARIGGFALLNPQTISQEITNYYKRAGVRQIPVRQGYARCSVCVVDEKSLITSDPGVAVAAESAGFSVLRIRPGYIKLQGYPYGFIGGACGKLAPDTLCFAGRIEGHPDYEAVRHFCRDRGVKVLPLTDAPLADVGGILPLAQEDG